jgi:hypothetical protein
MLLNLIIGSTTGHPDRWPVLLEIAMKYVVMLLVVCLAGCLANRAVEDVPGRINVFGIKLDSEVDYREIAGVKATEEPCLKGYERTFDSLDIVVGYGFNKKIRKITTRNYKTSMFGIRPGLSATEAGKLARQAGLVEVDPVRYHGNNLSLFLLVDGKGKVFGMMLESLD